MFTLFIIKNYFKKSIENMNNILMFVMFMILSGFGSNCGGKAQSVMISDFYFIFSSNGYVFLLEVLDIDSLTFAIKLF